MGLLDFDLAPECCDIEMCCMTVRISLMLLNISICHKANKLAMNTAWRPYEIRWPSPFAIEMAHPGIFTAKTRHGYAVFTLWMYPPTSLCPTLSAHTEPISQAHCWNWERLGSCLADFIPQLYQWLRLIEHLWLRPCGSDPAVYSSTFTFRSSGKEYRAMMNRMTVTE